MTDIEDFKTTTINSIIKLFTLSGLDSIIQAKPSKLTNQYLILTSNIVKKGELLNYRFNKSVEALILFLTYSKSCKQHKIDPSLTVKEKQIFQRNLELIIRWGIQPHLILNLSYKPLNSDEESKKATQSDSSVVDINSSLINMKEYDASKLNYITFYLLSMVGIFDNKPSFSWLANNLQSNYFTFLLLSTLQLSLGKLEIVGINYRYNLTIKDQQKFISLLNDLQLRIDVFQLIESLFTLHKSLTPINLALQKPLIKMLNKILVDRNGVHIFLTYFSDQFYDDKVLDSNQLLSISNLLLTPPSDISLDKDEYLDQIVDQLLVTIGKDDTNKDKKGKSSDEVETSVKMAGFTLNRLLTKFNKFAKVKVINRVMLPFRNMLTAPTPTLTESLDMESNKLLYHLRQLFHLTVESDPNIDRLQFLIQPYFYPLTLLYKISLNKGVDSRFKVVEGILKTYLNCLNEKAQLDCLLSLIDLSTKIDNQLDGVKLNFFKQLDGTIKLQLKKPTDSFQLDSHNDTFEAVNDIVELIQISVPLVKKNNPDIDVNLFLTILEMYFDTTTFTSKIQPNKDSEYSFNLKKLTSAHLLTLLLPEISSNLGKKLNAVIKLTYKLVFSYYQHFLTLYPVQLTNSINRNVDNDNDDDDDDLTALSLALQLLSLTLNNQLSTLTSETFDQLNDLLPIVQHLAKETKLEVGVRREAHSVSLLLQATVGNYNTGDTSVEKDVVMGSTKSNQPKRIHDKLALAKLNLRDNIVTVQTYGLDTIKQMFTIDSATNLPNLEELEPTFDYLLKYFNNTDSYFLGKLQYTLATLANPKFGDSIFNKILRKCCTDVSFNVRLNCAETLHICLNQYQLNIKINMLESVWDAVMANLQTKSNELVDVNESIKEEEVEDKLEGLELDDDYLKPELTDQSLAERESINPTNLLQTSAISLLLTLLSTTPSFILSRIDNILQLLVELIKSPFVHIDTKSIGLLLTNQVIVQHFDKLKANTKLELFERLVSLTDLVPEGKILMEVSTCIANFNNKVQQEIDNLEMKNKNLEWVNKFKIDKEDTRKVPENFILE